MLFTDNCFEKLKEYFWHNFDIFQIKRRYVTKTVKDNTSESECQRMCVWKRGRERWAGALVQWLWEETRDLKVVGSNPNTVYWMDILSH